ncbi:DNA internalization-related competence protein ComEC/Rec2 [Candidatus Nitrospira bockiana]
MLPRFTLALLSGLLLGSYVPYLPLTVLGVLLAIALILTVLEGRGRLEPAKSRLLFASLLAGVVYWNGYLWVVSNATLLDQVGAGSVMLTGTIVEPVRHGQERAVAIVSATTVTREGKTVPATGRIRLTWRIPDRSLRQGETVTFTAKLRPPSGTMNPGGFDYAGYLERHGIDAVASVSGPGQLVTGAAHATVVNQGWQLIDGWRERIRLAAVDSLQSPALGLYLGMVIGEPDYISAETRDLFMATGTVHILSISGSHLGLIALASFMAVRTVCRHLPGRWLLALSRYITATRLAALATVPLVVFYTVLAGAQVATIRSLIMIVLFLVAVWLGRDNRILWALASAAWLILLADPRSLFDISFQLSFVSVLALAITMDHMKREGSEESEPEAHPWRERIRAHARTYVLMTGGVTLATLPLVAYYFNQIPWLGLVANLVVVPLAGFVLVPLGLVSGIALLLRGGESLPFAWLNTAVSDLLYTLVERVAAIPGAEWHVASPSLVAITLFYALLLLAIRHTMPVWLRGGCLAALTALVVLWVWSPRQPPENGALRVTFLDVGQGDAAVLELPDGQTVLIDGGAAYDTLDMGRAVIGPYLWDRGIRRIDHVIATHPQLDHIGGLTWTVGKFEVGHYWSNGVTREEAFYRRLRERLAKRGLQEEAASAGGVVVDTPACRLAVLNPREAGSNEPIAVSTRSGSVLNDQSIVTRLDCGPHSFLFTADIEAGAIARLAQTEPVFRARVLKVPHHGARSSLDAQWIAAAKPEIAVISVGRTNPYGHPHPAVLAAYADRGVRVLRTDRDGAVQVIADLHARDFVVRRARDTRLERVRPAAERLDAERRNASRLWARWIGGET